MKQCLFIFILLIMSSFAQAEIINGHVLPPEPDPVINNSTLLGIDSNNNGVRDDVERKIYFHYQRPIEQAYMMQKAKWFPKTLNDPIAAANSKELIQEHWEAASCSGYLKAFKKVNTVMRTAEFMENSYFNTKERMRAYIKFNESMSGGSYNIPLVREYSEKYCDFNVTYFLELEQ